MVRKIKFALALAAMVAALSLQPSIYAQDSAKATSQDSRNWNFPRQGPSNFWSRHDLSGSGRQFGSSPHEFQNLQRA